MCLIYMYICVCVCVGAARGGSEEGGGARAKVRYVCHY